MRRSAAGLAVLAVLGAGCGSHHVTVGSSRLVVTQTVDASGGLPIEGAYSYVRIEKQGRAKVIEERLKAKRTTIRLQPGSYRLVSYQRTCDGSCAALDAPSARCDGTFSVAEHESMRANVRVNYTAGCTIRFAPE